MKLLQNFVFAFLASVVFFVQCKKTNERAKIDPEVTKYVYAFTSGLISNADKIIIQFYQPPTIDLGSINEKDLIKIEPHFDYDISWSDNRTLSIKPKELLPNNTLFNASLDLKKFFPDISKNLEFEFKFKTKPQIIDVLINNIQPYNINNLHWNKLEGTVETSDFVNLTELEKILKAFQENKSLKIKWNHDYSNKKYYFTVDSIYRSETKSTILLEWDGKLINSNNKGKEEVHIPSINDFDVLSIYHYNDPDQFIEINFSDPIDPSLDLSGIIYFKNVHVDFTYDVKLNQVKIYPINKVYGNYTLIIEPPIRNTKNRQLNKKIEHPVSFASLKPAVEIINEGNILPASGNAIFKFKAVNLKAVNVHIVKIFADNIIQFFQENQINESSQLARVGRLIYKGEIPLISENNNIDYRQWNDFGLDLSKLIKPDPGSIYRIYISFSPHQSLYPCENSIAENESSTIDDKKFSNFEGPDDIEYYYDDPFKELIWQINHDYDWDFDWEEYYSQNENPCHQYYYQNPSHFIAQNVFVSNIGIIAKRNSNNKIWIFVSDLLSAEPLGGAQIELYNFQNQLIGKGETQQNGKLELTLNNVPFLVVVKKNGQYGYLRVDDASALSLSSFDTDGIQAQEGIKGFIYTERDVWRPGDSIYVSFILENSNQRNLSNLPVVMELYTPYNQLYQKTVVNKSLNGFYDLRTSTNPDAPTGNWLLIVKAGAAKFSKTLKVETIKPNRIKMFLKNKKELITNENNVLDLYAEWLHGGAAANLKAIVEMSVKKTKTHFKNYSKYIFDDPLKRFESFENILFDNLLDNQGKAKISFDPEIQNPPGMLNIFFKTKVFEPSGDFSINVTSFPFSPYDSYVGFKLPDGDYTIQALNLQKTNNIPIVNVDPYGKLLKSRKLLIELFDIQYNWWWHAGFNQNPSEYISDHNLNLFYKDTIDNPNGKVLYQLKLEKNIWGKKFIRITDLASGHSSGCFFYAVSDDYFYTPLQGEAAEFLNFNTDKEVYRPGEEVKISIPVLYPGKLLLSIENHSNVIFSQWYNVDKTNNTITFRTTEEMSPNAFIHITLLQPYGYTSNDRPIRLYGVQRLKVENPLSHLYPEIKMPDKINPETTVNIAIREKNKQAMTYTIALVDEGLLDLTNFTTPDPWKKFYGRYALGINTFDMYKFVIGSYEGKLAGIYGIGGDQDLLVRNDKFKENRFKPMVVFLGPFELKENQTNQHNVKIPNYIGSVRVMVVAGNVLTGAYGSAEKNVKVINDLMILPSMPRTISPDEEIDIPVTIFALENAIKHVNIKLKTNNHLQIIGPSTKQVKFGTKGEKTISFRVKVKNKTGQAFVQVTAEAGPHLAHYELYVPVKIPSPKLNISEKITIAPGKTLEKTVQPIGVNGTNQAGIVLSGLPSVNFQEHLDYLITYPHGCLEQTVSSVFVQVFLDDVLELPSDQKTKIKSNIQAAINKLKNFQNSDGGFYYWPSVYYNNVDDWGTSYAGHFLVIAKKRGYPVPQDMINKWVDFQKSKANEWNSSLNLRYNLLKQAYRLYTLALAGKPFYSAMNRMRELTKIDPTAKVLLAATYHISGKPEIADHLLKSVENYTVPDYFDYINTYGSKVRDEALLAIALIHMSKWDLAHKKISEITKSLNSNYRYPTQSTSFGILAYCEYAKNFSKEIYADLFFENEKLTIKNKKPFIEIPVKEFNKTFKIKNLSNNNLFVEIFNSGQPLTTDNIAMEKNISMKVSFYLMDGTPADIKNIKQNTDLIAKVVISHKGILSDIQNMALSQIFPSGFEIINHRLFGSSSRWVSSNFSHQDIRDDRVLTYFDLKKGETKTFYVMLNAAYSGKYYMPSVKCEAMYDSDIVSITNGYWINIVKNEPL
ncbi:MAG: hypothetical protein KatS3mg034_1206 [Vicingaceae bacterium]|nr:MAG: hypothetical protein KatS3mg034_1206 [Vicingaceae bacterium]